MSIAVEHMRAVKNLVSLHIHIVSPEPSLLIHTKKATGVADPEGVRLNPLPALRF